MTWTLVEVRPKRCQKMKDIMNKQLLRISLSLFTLILLCDCRSLLIPAAAPIRKAEHVAFTAPKAPYQVISSANADVAWLSSKTGNTISFLSECESPADPSMKQIQNESLSVLNNLKVESDDEVPYNGRQALVSVATGHVDGVPIKMKLVIFKKNNCNYTLSYAGVEKNFSPELPEFNRFMQNFKAQ
jgi:hypothetical protein